MEFVQKLSLDDRVTVRRPGAPDPEGRCVVYWMQRAQRSLDNLALDVAIELGNDLGKPVVAFFAPVPFYPRANLRAYRFLVEGIPDVCRRLASRSVGFVLRAYPDHSILKFCAEAGAAILICDENSMREPEEWRIKVAQKIRIPFWTVDADAMVPTKLLVKEQYSARTIRPRIQALLPKFSASLHNPRARFRWRKPAQLHALNAGHDFLSDWKLDRSVLPVAGWTGGTEEALRILKRFVRLKLSNYPHDRNHPERDGTSRLSPYLHFGQLGPHTVAAAIRGAEVPKAAKDAFLEQLIVRRELSMNFVRFNPAYDSFECSEPWAQRSLAEHARDPRAILYTEEQLENAETHDPLWNAAQKQMTFTGWMHNYLRMYWAKKILEWSPTAALAYQRAVWLNDRYELDGRDPNGYAGIAWAIVGKHDRAWSERDVFGKIRYMSFASTSRKFDSKRYIEQIRDMEKGMTTR